MNDKLIKNKQEIFGMPIKYESWGKEEQLPFYISSRYEIYLAVFQGIQFLLLKAIDEIDTTSSIKKQINRIQEVENIPIAFALDNISFYRRKSFVENMIPFITKKQVFLPFLGVALRNEPTPEKKAEKFTLSTQLLFLYYLYCGKKKMYVSDAAKKLPFSAMTITRAIRQLEESGLFYVYKKGVNIIIEAKQKPLVLLNEAKDYFINPVSKRGYIFNEDITDDMVLAGESELSRRTMLNESDLKTYAICKKNFNNSKMINELIDVSKQVRVEIWKYEPTMFSRNNKIDTISLALSFLNEEDERVQIEIEEILKKEYAGIEYD